MILFIKKQKIYNIIFFLALIFACVSVFSNGFFAVPTMSIPLSGRVIVIDPGHGTPDGGAVGYSGSKEKDLNLLVAKSLGNLLQQSGAHVIYTRQGDSAIADNINDSIRNVKKSDMKKRKTIRDESGADLFISIHMNKFPQAKYKGAQVFYETSCNDSELLAGHIQNQIKLIADSSNTREIKNSKKDIFILNGSKIPSVLVECGFLSNPGEEQKLLSKSYQDKMAYAIYSGILKYFSNI